MVRNKILKIFFICLITSSCSVNLNNFPDKAQEPENTPKSYLIDYSLRKEKIQERYKDINFNSEDKIKIAVMLPLSGPHEKLGKALFNSMQLALFDHADPRIHLVPFDTQGNEYESITQAKNIIEENYSIIIGPVFSKNVEAIKPLIKDHNIKIISFSNNAEIAGNNVFLIGLDIKEQVRAVTNYAYDQGYRYFTAILPSNDYGSTIVTELRRVAYLKDITVLKSEFYSQQTSLDKNIRNIARVIKEYPAKDESSQLEPETEQQSTTDGSTQIVDANFAKNNEKIAILIPEGGKMLQSILELMHKYNIPQEKVQLIGLNNWYDGTNYKDKYMTNAWFTDIPHENYDLFLNYYQSYFYATPPRIAALSYDALSVVTSLAGLDEQSPNFSSEMLTQEIGFNGISGVFRFRDTGISERLLAIYGIESGEVVKISPEAPLFSALYETEK